MYERTEMLIGAKNISKLKNSHIAVFGIGGVGSFVCEALARAGTGKITLVDHDIIARSNINRQLHALNSTIGKYKADSMKERILDINPEAEVVAWKYFIHPDTLEPYKWDFDYIADAVDNVTAKIHIITTAKAKGIDVISSMGTGNKLNPARFAVADIYETSVCPLAKVMRKELRKRGVENLTVVFSDEQPIKLPAAENQTKQQPSSISFVPSCAGLIMAGEIIRDICLKK